MVTKAVGKSKRAVLSSVRATLLRLVALVVPWVVLACSGARPHPSPVFVQSFPIEVPEGFWQDQRAPDSLMEITHDRIKVARGGEVQGVSKVLSWKGHRIRFCQNGVERAYEFVLEPNALVLGDPQTGDKRRFRKLLTQPSGLELEALPLPLPVPLKDDQLREIQAELSTRLRADQEVLVGRRGVAPGSPPFLQSPPDPWGSAEDLGRLAVFSENTRYLKELISRVGWIDTARFGYPTSNSAFLLVQHSGDLSLMMAALEGIRRDLEAGHPVGEPYALLFDRLQLRLGERQRYGTQIGRDAFGQPLVLPTEDPEKVAALREELGIFPLLQAVRFFGGSEVRFSQECAASPPGSVEHPSL